MNLTVQNKPVMMAAASEDKRFAVSVAGSFPSFDPDGYRKEFVELIGKVN